MKWFSNEWFKTNWSNYLFVALILVFLFNNNAKAWVLKQFISIGVFNSTSIEKNNNDLKDAPAFSFYDAHGNKFNTSSLKGKVVFVNFWATWCLPCRAELPAIGKFYNQYKNNKNIFFLTINEDDDLEMAKDFLRKSQYTIPLYIRGEEVPDDIFKGSLPTTLIIDKQGRIRLHHEGIANYDAQSFLKQIQDLVKE